MHLNNQALNQLSAHAGNLIGESIKRQYAPAETIRARAQVDRATDRLSEARQNLTAKLDILFARLNPVRKPADIGPETGDDAVTPAYAAPLTHTITHEARQLESLAAQVDSILDELEI